FNIPTFKRNNRWFIHLDYPINNTLWHRRVGHLSIRHLKRMQKYNTVIGIPNISLNDIRICHDCSMSKSQHRPVKTASRQLINQPGDLIVADLMGPYETSLNNKKYILMIQDAFSRVVVAIPLCDKSESKTYFISWIKQFMNITKHTIKMVRTDNSTEFKNNIFNDFLAQHGIIHEYSMPYKHHQNGRIERTNRTISEMARTSLIAARLPSFLWPWAFRHSVWIFNHYLHVDINRTPFEILGKRRPDLSLLRVFGAKSYLYNHNFKKDFSPRATVGYHMGVSEDSKGWLFWIPAKENIVKSASVSFDELTFYDGVLVNSNINVIQVQDVFDDSMVKELDKQDELIPQILNHNALQVSIPSTYKEAIILGNKDEWIGAINEEIGSMATEKVFTTFDLGDALKEVPHESILSTKWVFTKKPGRFKARLVWPIRTFDVKVAFLHSLIDKPVFV
ncbi:hypothetical protein O181_075894, partial [Austropuccinia psidii MF-1]|nr:hypothetical protein [Austropuccinia psidii MF-1]